LTRSDSLLGRRRLLQQFNNLFSYFGRQRRPAFDQHIEIDVDWVVCDARIGDNLCINCCATRCALARILVFVDDFGARWLFANPPS